MRKKSLIRRLIPWIILAIIIGGLVYLGIRLYSNQETENSNPPIVAYFEEENPPKITIANENLELVFDQLTTQFTLNEIKDGKTVRTWKSNPDKAKDDPIAKTTNKDSLFSTLYVTFTTPGGKKTYNNYTYSIKKLGFTIEQPDDNSIQVNYSIGDIEKIYKIPYAMTDERYEQYKTRFGKVFKNNLSTAYKTIGPSTIDKQKDKDAIIASYPEVLNQDLHILSTDDTINEYRKLDMESLFEEAGYTDEDYEADMSLVAEKPDSAGPVFNVSVIYRLEGKDFVVEIPYDKIRYRKGYEITQVAPLPMFGAADSTEEGFLFVPEGGGAIIRYNNGKLNQTKYYANLYGWDYGEERKEAVSETEDAFPVFGATKGDASYICIMEGASSYGGVYADIAGEGHDNSFNTVYGEYNVLHAAQYSVSNKTAQLVYIYESEIPDVTIRQIYRFVDSNDYIDMANAYGDYLRAEKGMDDAQASEEMPVNVELIGAINKKVVKAGVPVDSVVATTTFVQARQILNELSDSGIKDLSIRMTGWANGGVHQKVLTGVHVLNELGGSNEMNSLIVEARSRNVDLYFDGINCFAYDSGLAEGFVPFSHAARYATREQIVLSPFDIVIGDLDEWKDRYYLVKPSYAKENASKLINALKEKNAAGVAFRDIGNLLSADYNPADIVTREQVKAMNIETMKEASAAGLKVMIKEGNDYAVPYADRITDMNLTGQAYGIIDEQIPFYQAALHGMKDFTGEPINLSGDYRTMLLESAEYGAGLNFTFMAENTRVLKDSVYSNYTASGYDFWKGEVIPMIQRYQAEMSGLNRKQIVAHQHTGDIAETVYDDGTRVYVNYGNADANVEINSENRLIFYGVDEVQVPARDYVVVRNEKTWYTYWKEPIINMIQKTEGRDSE